MTAQDRVVFVVKNKYSNEYAGAVGRALNRDIILNGLCMVVNMFHLFVVRVMTQ